LRPLDLGLLQLAHWGRWSHTSAGRAGRTALARHVGTGSVDMRLVEETAVLVLILDTAVVRIGLAAVVDMGRCMARELDSGRVGSHPVMVVRKAADRTGFDRCNLVVDVVADIADIPAAGSLPADSFPEVLRSLVLVLATRID